MSSEVLNSSKKEDIAMEATVSPLENFSKREVEETKGATEISGGEDHDDCYEIDFLGEEEEEEEDDDEDYCYVIDHSNHREHYVISHCEVIADEGYDNGEEYDDSDFDDVDDDDDGEDDDDEEEVDDSDDDSCIEIVPTEFSQKISIQVPNMLWIHECKEIGK